MVEQLNERTIYDDKNRPIGIKDLTQVDVNFIENERLISSNDFLYCATHYFHIKSKLTQDTESVILYSPNIAQNIIIDQWAADEAQFHAIMYLFLKARQLGISTLVELVIAFIVMFRSHTNALVASSDPDKTKKMASMMELAWSLLPWWLKPSYTITRSKEVWAIFNFEEGKSSVTCQHGTAMSGIARGDTPDVFHLSELPDFRNPLEDVDAALLNAIHESPSTFGALESTAKGKTGKGAWWYNKWKFAKKWFPRNKTRLRPVFLPWFVGTDVWPTATWCHQFLPSNLEFYKFKEVTLAHAKKCKEYVASSPLLRKYLGVGWQLPLHQMYFWEFTRQEFEESGQLHKFLEEMPASDEEAFQRTGYGIISTEQAEWLRNHTKPLATWQGGPAVFGIIGDGISPEDEPLVSEIDTTRPYITIKADWDYSSEPKTYRLVPLIHDLESWNNRLFIWEFPNNVDTYALGVDGAEGLEGLGDNSSIEVISKMSPLSPAEQVAEFTSCSLSTIELLPIVLAIGTLYSKVTEDETNQCRAVIELAAGGHALQHQLRLTGWINFHRWHGAYQNIKRKTPSIIGWETNAWTRPMIMTLPIKAIKDGSLRINSPFLIEELVNLQKDIDDNAKIEAKGDEHDDRALSLLFTFFSLHDWELLLMMKGDTRIRQMFQSYGGALPIEGQQEGLVISLNEAIVKAEDSRKKDVTKSGKYVGNFMLPTLND